MHGVGNDLMVIDLISQHAYIQPQHIRAWSDRRQGVGFLRLALIEVPQHPDDDLVVVSSIAMAQKWTGWPAMCAVWHV